MRGWIKGGCVRESGDTYGRDGVLIVWVDKIC